VIDNVLVLFLRFLLLANMPLVCTLVHGLRPVYVIAFTRFMVPARD
jgi:hypothetical protein